MSILCGHPNSKSNLIVRFSSIEFENQTSRCDTWAVTSFFRLIRFASDLLISVVILDPTLKVLYRWQSLAVLRFTKRSRGYFSSVVSYLTSCII